ncbi:hypothetical protein A2U01_0097606, partial [Trifolium medium]|nr:hypothetical protein [Trifolium medium]
MRQHWHPHPPAPAHSPCPSRCGSGSDAAIISQSGTESDPEEQLAEGTVDNMA